MPQPFTEQVAYEGVEASKTTWRSSGFIVMWEDQVGGKKG